MKINRKFNLISIFFLRFPPINIINIFVNSILEALAICALNTFWTTKTPSLRFRSFRLLCEFSAPRQMEGELLVLSPYVPCAAANYVNENLGTTSKFYALEG